FGAAQGPPEEVRLRARERGGRRERAASRETVAHEIGGGLGPRRLPLEAGGRRVAPPAGPRGAGRGRLLRGAERLPRLRGSGGQGRAGRAGGARRAALRERRGSVGGRGQGPRDPGR